MFDSLLIQWPIDPEQGAEIIRQLPTMQESVPTRLTDAVPTAADPA
jgi:hypothetical protein